jgi:hypothetical protein
MTQKINIMISSVVNGLEAERNAIKERFTDIQFVELIGARPYNSTAHSASSAHATIEMARTCDLYVLILSEKYGMEILGGQSATEAEFDAAVKGDPTKIMVFLKETTDKIEEKQKEFIEKVSNYYSGYFRSSFNNPDQLKEMVFDSFIDWLVDRAQLSRKLNYLDHFVMVAKQISPLDGAKVYYKVTEEFVEIEYAIAGATRVIQFDNIKLANNFWGCVYELRLQCNKWSRD